MNVLLLEDEVYLAQKVSARLSEEGYSCDIATTLQSIHQDIKYDIVILSTNLPASLCDTVISRFSTAIIILLVSYISDATVTRPIRNGAVDYIVKPFVIDELIRKIKLFTNAKQLKQKNAILQSFVNGYFENKEPIDESVYKNQQFIIQTVNKKIADSVVLDIALNHNLLVDFVDCSNSLWHSSIEKSNTKLFYLYNTHLIKKNARAILISHIKDCRVILHSTQELEEIELPKIILQDAQHSFVDSTDNLMPLHEYMKAMILRYQDIYPDTVLSKKLGISRKSLWERRKKMDLEKKK